MLTALLNRWHGGISVLFWQRVLHRHRPEKGPITLDRRRVYVLPTRSGLTLGAILLAMLLGAINYNNSLAYALTFLLASLSIVSVLHTFRNVHGLTFHPGHPPEVFAGGSVRFPLAIENRSTGRFAVAIQVDNGDPLIIDIDQGELRWIDLYLPSQRRGWMPLPRVTVSTLYPLGLFRAWSYLRFDVCALIYPSPAADQALPILDSDAGATGGDQGRGNDDFAQLRPYHIGDSLHHVHWKAYARELGLVVKQFGAMQATEIWLTWESASERDVEGRLSQLCRWVLDAEAAGITYGLLMPSHRVEPAHGEAHRRRCLEILALHGIEARYE